MQHLGCKLVLLVGLVACGAASLAVAQPDDSRVPASPASRSYAQWVLASSGLCGFLAVTTGVAVFLGACAVVVFARRPAVVASYLLFLLLPLLLGLMGTLKDAVSTFSVLAMADVSVKPSAFYGFLSEALVPPLMALMVTLPSFCLLAIGLFVRTILAGRRPAARARDGESPFVVARPAGE